MEIKNFDELSSLEIDTLREIGSIGTGNAATALSQMIGKEVRITLPEVRIMGQESRRQGSLLSALICGLLQVGATCFFGSSLSS